MPIFVDTILTLNTENLISDRSKGCEQHDALGKTRIKKQIFMQTTLFTQQSTYSFRGSSRDNNNVFCGSSSSNNGFCDNSKDGFCGSNNNGFCGSSDVGFNAEATTMALMQKQQQWL